MYFFWAVFKAVPAKMLAKMMIMIMEQQPPVAVSYWGSYCNRRVIGWAKKSHDFKIYLSFFIVHF